MKIAIPYSEDETLYEHTGTTENFKIYEIDSSNNIVFSEIVPTNEDKHAAIAPFLKEHGVNILLCKDIGSRLFNLLKLADIKCYSMLEGNCDTLINDYLNGSLTLNEEATHECSCHH